MGRHGKGAGSDTGAPGGCFAGGRWGLDTVSGIQVQRLGDGYRVCPALIATVAALIWREADR
jgi:hypothetical protein